jgi:two-component system, NtrC family, nitrogen regulation sensor histidine kinase NtrY
MNLLRNKYFLLYLVLALILGLVYVDVQNTKTLGELSQQTGEKIKQKYEELADAVGSARGMDPEKLQDVYSTGNIGVYVYTDQKLAYWNNSQIPVPTRFTKELSERLVKLKNGYYLVNSVSQGSTIYVALTILKTEYDLQNDYLIDNFASWLDLPQGIDLRSTKVSGNEVMLNDTHLFSLSGPEAKYKTNKAIGILTILFFLTCVIFLLFILLQVKREPFAKMNLAYIALVILLRFIMLQFKWPAFLYDGDLYDLILFGNAQSYFNSFLGDLILNSILLIWLTVIAYFWLKNTQKKFPKAIYISAGILLLLVNLAFHHHLSNSIISNSTISFDFLNLLNLHWYSYVALIPIVLVNISILILLYVLFKYALKQNLNSAFIYLGVSLAISLLLNFISPSGFWVEKWWFFPVSVLVLLIGFSKLEKNILAVGGMLLLMAVISSAILNFYISKNQQQDFDVLSYKLTDRQDAVLESEFYNLSGKIDQNEQLLIMSQFVNVNGDKEFLQLLRQNFFFGYFDRYNIEFSMFDENCKALIENTQPIMRNEGFFEEQITYRSAKTASPYLFFIDQYKDNSRYMARIPLGKNKLYILLEPKYFEEVGAFPDLLIDASQQKLNKLRNLSHVVYRSGINNKMYGDFNYPVNLNDSVTLSKVDPDYTHHYLYPDENSAVIISTKTKNLSYFFTYNSYLFLLFSLIAYLSYISYSIFFAERNATSSLTRRIQSTVIFLLLVSITAVGITSSKLVSDQFDKENEKQLQEKSESILSELSGVLQNSDTITDVSKELIDLTIKRYAQIFKSEVSVFDNTGQLYISSQPRLYELGLAAPLLNSQAFANLKNDLVSSYTSKDKAGNLNYLSLYAPIYNANKKLLGYLNLPYFGKQSKLINELSGIISTLINVYVILFIISILSGLVLSGYITLPLRILKQQMANVSLGKKNEALVWESNDEVGKLVSEYNSMIDKLDKSAGLLAKSEREIAWREMAKQVAHEIKNPLTPMKLNLQYLQHVIKTDPKDFEEKFAKASTNIIEQIDALANIATEFSNFAKLPSGELEKINLAEVISSTVDLFEKEKKVKISLDLHSKEIIVMADREQMLRVFNNLLTNAIQATSEVKEAHIEMSSSEMESGKGYVITVADNGCGIPEKLKQNIFTPNFTTKSTGSGLGLAMIKNIFDNIGASIWFESEENKGTIFYLEFKKDMKA